MPFEPTELVVNTEDLPWLPMGVGAWGKILRVCAETGTWTVLFKQEAGTFAPPHKHLAAAIRGSEHDLQYDAGTDRELVRKLFGVAMHDAYHTGQIQLIQAQYTRAHAK